MKAPVIKQLLTTKKLTITYIPPSSLKPDPRNPRLHSKKHVRQIGTSIITFGFIIPLVVDAEDNIICGHGRWAAAIELGLEEVPTVCAAHLTEAQIKAFRIADNRLSEISVWNDPMLAENLRELAALDLSFDIEDIGFNMNEINLRIESLSIKQEGGPDPDDQLPDAIEGPTVSKIGDLWLLGGNRVLHGDATKLSDVENLMGGKRATTAFCDAPYGVNYANSAKDKLRGTHRPILNDNLGDQFEEFLYAACSNILSVTDGGIYLPMSSSALHILQSAFLRAGGHWSTFIIWAKQTFTLGRADYQRQYEPILYGWREGAERYWCGARDQGDVWFINKPVKNDLHPTMKPVELVMRALRNSSRRGDIVLDTFLGSGSSLIAAERSGRICYGIELDSRYVDVAIRRWQSHTGDQAVHATTGKTFNEVAAEVRHDA
jgi:DNA modification methylase